MENIESLDRRYTWKQTQLIHGYAVMGRSITEGLAADPDLADELSSLVHNTSLSYAGVLSAYFFESGHPLADVVNGPIIRGFEGTPHFTSEEAQFLTELRQITASPNPVPEDATQNFREWVDSRMDYFSKGFQRCVLEGQVIAPLSEAERIKQSGDRQSDWLAKNPKEKERIHALAVQGVKDAAHPIVYTDEVRAQIQAWFDQGFDYNTVSLLLKGIGIETNEHNLVHAVTVYDDLHYTPEEIRRKNRQGFLEALPTIWNFTGSRRETMEIMGKLGYTQVQVSDALKLLGLKERIRWDSTEVEYEGEKVKIKDVAVKFIGSKPTVRDEWKTLTAHLKEKGVKLSVTEASYTHMRERYFASSQDFQPAS